MKVYKERQYLIFDFEDGRNVKYNFATKEAIGIKGKSVKDLNKQLRGFSLEELMDCCVDKQYSKFLNYIRERASYGKYITNIGTILSKVPFYSKYEQFFSAGFDDIINDSLSYELKDIPKSLLKNAHLHNIKLSNEIIKFWKENANDYNLAYNIQYTSLDDYDIYKILTENQYSYRNNYQHKSYFNILIKEYKYNAKSLLLYLDQLKTFEAIDDMWFLIKELYDYANMMDLISKKYDKYPRHFLTTHKIACRNYNRLKKEYPEELFVKRINKDYEFQYKDYVMIYPKCIQDIRDEAVSQNNCVASYIDRVINGDCHIMFLRKKDSPDKSLVTIEISNNKIVQAKRRFNYPITEEEQDVVNAWNKKFNKEINEKEKAA